METIEELVEKEASYQKIGRHKFIDLYREIIEDEKERKVEYVCMKKNLSEIGKIIRFCTNPYAALISIRDIYTEPKTKRIHDIINWLYVTYQSRTKEMELNGSYTRNMKFTPQEINELISVAQEKIR